MFEVKERILYNYIYGICTNSDLNVIIDKRE